MLVLVHSLRQGSFEKYLDALTLGGTGYFKEIKKFF